MSPVRLRFLFSLFVGMCCLSLSQLACAYHKPSTQAVSSPTTKTHPVADPSAKTQDSRQSNQAPAQQRAATHRSLVSGEAPASPSTTERKIIHRGDFHLTLQRYETFAQQLETHLKTLQGYVADLSVSRALRGVSSANLVVKVPTAQFPGFLSWLRKQGEVTYERLSGEDITAQYFDLQARLRNQKRLEQRFLQILQQKTASLKDIVAVERELARVRETIESMEGQTRVWNHLVALATVRLHLFIKQPYQPAKSSSFASKLQQRLLQSWREFRNFLEDIALGIAAALPWLVFALLLWKFWRWRRKRPVENRDDS